MKWISDRKPNSPGLYGTLLNSNKRDPFTFYLAYYDGIGWKIPSESDEEISPYRDVQCWCKLEIGED